jgi:hypothetical protein
VKYILFISFLITTCNIDAQKTDSCTCFGTYSIRYPKKAQDNKIGGTVIVEFDRDSNCVFSNPIVIKGLGYGCDEEALRLAKQKADQSLKCALKCPGNKCSIDKVRWPITFQYVPE